MRRSWNVSLLALAMAVSVAYADPPAIPKAKADPAPPAPAVVIDGPAKADPYTLVTMSAKNADAGTGLWWTVKRADRSRVKKVQFAGGIRDAATVEFTAPPGDYDVTLTVITVPVGGKPVVRELEAQLTIGDPDPPAPTPGPTPGPTPPTPTAAPFPCDGLHVLIVFDAATETSLPAAQQAVLYAKAVRDYLDAKCPAGPDGKTREWRIYPATTDVSAEGKVWAAAMGVKRAALPWVVISDGKTGFSGALPATVDDTLALLKKYGG